MSEEKAYAHTNSLIHESSPYLLQHAHNPVDWYPWGEEAIERARRENKLMLVSIGYSACHWCHVMERESFEDPQIARLMNDSYVCIKVDREERPDVDQFFMDAAQIMTGRGGWPLNAFALPDGRPVYAGTYFPKNQWSGLLREIAGGYKRQPEKYVEYAEKLMAGIKGLIPETPAGETEYDRKTLQSCYLSFEQYFDRQNGGLGRAPKFPMPDNYAFLLRYHHLTGSQAALDQAVITLDKMAMGGIYDQIGGGFARYSTDESWKVPHFEKMLYDNAQLLGLYSEAWQVTGNEIYRQVVYQTSDWLQREMASPEGAFYCALDADSEGVEGKYYVWTSEEFEAAAGEHTELLKEYYSIGKEGYWEDNNNILLIAGDKKSLAQKHGLTAEELNTIVSEGNRRLLAYREERIKPGLDDKILLSWNALAIKGYITAYKAFGDQAFLKTALKNLHYLQAKLVKGNKLFHSIKKNGEAIPGFLEDYAYYIQALIEVYQVTFDEKHLQEAMQLMKTTIEDFSHEANHLFYFTPQNATEVAARKIDLTDNVMPSPNSVMAHNLFKLGKLMDQEEFTKRAIQMLGNVSEQLQQYGSFFANWAILLGNITYPFHEVAITGPEAQTLRQEVETNFVPNKIVSGTADGQTHLPLLSGKYTDEKTQLYICEGNTCLAPVSTASEALKLMTATK